MALSLGLGAGRPQPVAICGFSGFIPVVEGWEPELLGAAAGRPRARDVRSGDPGRVRPGRRDQLVAAGGELLYEEYPLAHQLDPAFLVFGAGLAGSRRSSSHAVSHSLYVEIGPNPAGRCLHEGRAPECCSPPSWR